MMNESDDFDEGDYEMVNLPPRGILNPFWMFRTAISRANYAMLWDALVGLTKYMEEAIQKDVDDHFHAEELFDVMTQYMYTGEYISPFEGDREESPDAITEEEIEKFVGGLDMNVFPPYIREKDTDDKEND